MKEKGTNRSLAIAGLAVMLCLPSLWNGLVLDDHFNRLVVSHREVYVAALPQSRLDSYNFFDGDLDRFHAAIDRGLWPWWTNPRVKAAFWRPLTSLTQFVDYCAWPDHPWLMHLQSIAWYASLVLAVAALFRRFMVITGAAALAALMFAVDDAHGIPVGFLANRNSVMACLFGVLCVIFHDRRCRDGKRAMGVVALLSFAAALLSAEAGIGAMAYLAAYALFMDRRPMRVRGFSLVPYLVVLVVWRAAWSAMGYGVRDLVLYTDPIHQAPRFLSWLWRDAPLMIAGQCLPVPAELLSSGWAIYPWVWWVVAAIAALLLWGAWLLMRVDRVAAFFGTGALLALIPTCTTLPQNRNLIFVGIGAFGLISIWLAGRSSRLSRSPVSTALAILLIFSHLVIAPLLLPLTALCPGAASAALRPVRELPGMEQLAGRDLVILNHPIPLHLAHFLASRAANQEPLPNRARVLAHAFSHVTVTRTSPAQLRVQSRNGFPGLLSYALGASSNTVAVNDRVRTAGMEVEVTATDEAGMAVEAIFTFDRRLEDDSLTWVQWRDGAFRLFDLPAIGQSVTLPPIELPFGLSATRIDRSVRNAVLIRQGGTVPNSPPAATP